VLCFFPALSVLAGSQAIRPPVKMPLIPGDFLSEQVKQEYQVGGTGYRFTVGGGIG